LRFDPAVAKVRVFATASSILAVIADGRT